MVTRSLDPGERRSGEGVLRLILPGAKLESVTFRIAELTLCFVNPDADEAQGLPTYVWLTTVSDARVLDSAAASRRASDGRDDSFPDGRARFLSAIYGMLGDEISAVAIAGDGALTLQAPQHAVVLQPADSEPEEIWSVTSETPGPLGEHRWRVTLSNSGRLVVKRPPR